MPPHSSLSPYCLWNFLFLKDYTYMRLVLDHPITFTGSSLLFPIFTPQFPVRSAEVGLEGGRKEAGLWAAMQIASHPV